jgi:N4-gp56 family major capsid protein
MAAAMNRTGGLTAEMMTYYDKVFLDRAEYALVLDQGGQKRSQGGNVGKSIVFTRYTPLSIVTGALSEGANPATTTLVTGTNVSCTLAEYGQTLKVAKFLSLTSIDSRDKEKIELVGQNMGETLNRLVRAQLASATATYAPYHSRKISTIKSSETLDANDVRSVLKTLEINKAQKYPDGTFMGKVDPYEKYNIIGDTTWLAPKEYVDPTGLYKAEIGSLYGVRFIENVDALSSAGTASSSTVTCYSTYIHGANAFGCYDLEGDTPKMYITSGLDSGNQTGRFQMISWAGSYVVKILNSDWIRELHNAV